MITNAFRQDSEAFVFQKSQVSCQGLGLQKNLVFYQVLNHVYYQVYYQVFSQVPNPRFSWFSMITNAFLQDSEAIVFQKSQVSCQGLSLQKYYVFYYVYYYVFTMLFAMFSPGSKSQVPLVFDRHHRISLGF